MYWRYLVLASMVVCCGIGYCNWGAIGGILGAFVGLFIVPILSTFVFWAIRGLLGR